MSYPWKRVFLAGICYLVIATVIRQIEGFLTMDYYLMPEFASVWSKIMMPTAGPPPASFFLLSALFELITGFGLAALFVFVKEGMRGQFWNRVARFTGMIFGLAIIFFTLPTILLIHLPIGLQVSWTLSTLLVFFLTSVAFARVLR